ncbi:Stage V sporulation protein K [compost metagenome]
MASRFPNKIHFPDYNVPDLVRIAQQMLLEQEYQAAPDYLDALSSVMWVEKSKPNFGNARSVRNHIERSIRKQSIRVSQIQQPSRMDLATLIAADLVYSPDDLQATEREALNQIITEVQGRLLQLDLLSILKA